MQYLWNSLRKPTHYRAIWGIVFALLALPACWLTAETVHRSTPVATGTSTVKTDSKIVAEQKAYRTIIETLCQPGMQGRAAGTKGIDKARNYLAVQLKRAGLKPLFGKTYAQPFPVNVGQIISAQSLAFRMANGSKVQFAAGREFHAAGCSRQGQFAGRAVFVGYGIDDKQRSYNSFAGLKSNDLRGAVAVAFRFEPLTAKGHSQWGRKHYPWTSNSYIVAKSRQVAKRGAKALLVVNPPSCDSQLDSHTTFITSAAGLQNRLPVMQITTKTFARMLALSGYRNPDKAMRTLQKNADTNKPHAAALSAKLTIAGQIELKSKNTIISNVAGVLPGVGKLAKEYIIVGAHYDHLVYNSYGARHGRPGDLFPGADDNASGTAGLILMAKHLQQRYANSTTPRRSVIFVAFAGEEIGLKGSAHMAEHLKQFGATPADINAMINMDMIGRLRENKLYIWNCGTGEGIEAMIERANKTLAKPFQLSYVRFGGAGSDHLSFYRKGIPNVMFHSGLHKDYHTPADILDKLNIPDAVRILHLEREIIHQMAVTPKRIAYRGHKNFRRKPYLGIRCDGEPKNTAGCQITRVMPNSPAAAAKLQSGDRIFRWNKVFIQSKRDLLKAFSAAKPGQVVHIQVHRNNKPLKLTVTLGCR